MKIICIGRNYVDHAKELNNPVPSSPLVFMKPSTALLRNNYPFFIPDFTKDVHYECELVLKICKNGKHVDKQFASSYFEEVGLGIDFTARDVQARCKEKGHPWEKAKAFDHSAAISKFVPKKEAGDYGFELQLNGDSVQRGNTEDLIFPLDDIIVHVSKYFTLHVGDFIYTGTPAGVGPVKIGDRLTGFLEGMKMFDFDVR